MKNTTLLENFPKCFTLISRSKDSNLRNELSTAIYAILIPLIICANMLLILGLIKTKQNKFTSCQILFLTLFISDLTFGVVQLPTQIYILWKSGDPTCFEIKLGAFSMAFSMCMSGNILCLISIDRYITIVHTKYYKRTTNKQLAISIILMILISFMWATFEADFKANLDIKKTAKLYFALSGYAGAVMALVVGFNVALLRNVKRRRKNSSVTANLNSSKQQAIDSILSKTIAIIVAVMIAAYLPIMIILTVAAFVLINSTDPHFLSKNSNDFMWALMPCQINAILNSVIYFTKNSRMRRYYKNLFTCRNEKNSLKMNNSNKKDQPLDSIFIVETFKN